LASPSGPVTAGLAEAGVTLVDLPELKLPSGPRAVAALWFLGRSLRASRRLRRAARDADLVVVNGLLGLPALRLARIRLPTAWIVHDYLRRREERAVLRACAAAVTLAIPVSAAVAGPVRAAGICARVVHNGTPWPVEPASPGPLGPPVIGCNALLTPWKGHHVLLDAVARLSRADVVVELLGGTFPKDGPYVRSLHERAEQADLAGRVRFLGHVPDPSVVMRAWSVAVSPSVEPEACPLAVLEAMSLGLPVIGTDHGGTPELLEDPDLRVAPGDPGAMAAAIDRLLGDDALRRRLSAQGRSRVAAHFQLDGQLALLLDALRELAAPASPPVGPGPGSSLPDALSCRGPLVTGDRAPTARRLVVFVVADFEPAVGGIGRQTRLQAEALLGGPHQVVVVTRRLDRRWPRQELLDRVQVVRVGTPGRGAVPEKLSLAAMAAWLVRHRREISIVQVVMYADYVLSAAAAGLLDRTVLTWASRGDATEMVGRRRGGAKELQQRVRRRVLGRCRHVALSPSMAAELNGVGLGPVEVIPVPVDTARFRPPQTAERGAARAGLGIGDELVVVYTGHLRALKAVDRLVEAFGQLVASDRDARLVLVGGDRGADDDREAELRAQVRASGLGDRVRFTGVVDDVLPFLWAGDIFVLPSSREGLPNSLLEAMACGLACVAPASAAGDELLGRGAGVVPASNEARHLAGALVDLADDPARREELSRAATAEAARYSVAGVGGAYERLYAEMLR